jgi:CubicO group peptidase (beta-lactamase class C family)
MSIKKHLNVLMFVVALSLCSCTKEEDEIIFWQPVEMNDGLQVSSAAAQGVDSINIDITFKEATKLDNLYSLLILKNGYLIAEGYFNNASVDDARRIASATKSITSALAGVAIREGFIEDTDQKLKDFFPEIDWDSTDPRKSEITVEQILQMRTGYPWEEFDGYLETLLNSADWIPFLEEFPLMHDPGTQFGYSNFTAHMMAIIIARSTEQTLLSFAREYLFDEMEISVPNWPRDVNGYFYGSGDAYMTPRSLAKFGQLYLDGGIWNDIQLVPSEWVNRSFTIYSSSTYGREILTHISDLKYGYLWWSGTSGSHQIWFAWGHGGQLVVIIQDLNMVVVATAQYPPLFDDAAWPESKAVMELVGRFVSNL